MWIAKFKFWHPNSLAIEYMKKYKLTMLAFPLNHYVKEGVAHITSAHIILGEEKSKQKYYTAIIKEKRITHFEREGDVLIYSLDAPISESHLQMYFTPEIFLVKPLMARPDGFEYIELASWDKTHLTELLNKIGKFGKVYSLNIRREKLTDIYIPHLMPKVTVKQKEAILLAYRNGYYECPKKITIERLASLAGLSQSTFQEHLRKAEEKLIPFLLENISEK